QHAGAPMSAAHTNNIDLMAPPVIKSLQRALLIVGVVASVIVVAGAFMQPQIFFRAYLINFMDWLGICLGSMAILMLRHLTKGGWGMIIRRILGAAMRTLPLLALLFIPILFALSNLYPWVRPLESITDKHVQEHLRDITRSYLSVHGFIIRAVLYFAIWG